MNPSKELLNFNEILQLFNSAISQEQAWAVLYQLLKEFKSLLENNFNTLYQFINDFNNNNNSIYSAINLDIIYFRQDGSVYIHLINNSNFSNNKIKDYDDSFESQGKKIEIFFLIIF